MKGEQANMVQQHATLNTHGHRNKKKKKKKSNVASSNDKKEQWKV